MTKTKEGQAAIDNAISRGKGIWFQIKARKKLSIIILVIILVIGFLGYRQYSANQNKPKIQTAKVQKGTVVSTVTASGSVLTTNNVSITTSASGVVKDVFVKEGDSVTAGQKIMDIALDQPGQVKNAQAYALYLSAKNGLDTANYTYYTLQTDLFTKWKTFYDLATNSTYQNSDGSPNTTNRALPEFLEAQNNWLAAEAKDKAQQAVIAQAQAAVSSAWLSYQSTSADVTAPIAGTVSNITYIPGVILAQQASTTSNSNQRVAVISNSSTPSITVNLSEADISKVQLGRTATITLDSMPDKTFTGKVVTMDKIGAVASGVTTYPAIIQFDTSTEQILPNMAVTASIIIETKDDVLEVPSSAISNSGGQSTIRVLVNGQAQSVPVETGISSDQETEITSGLTEGEDIVIGSPIATQGRTGSNSSSPFGAGGGGVFRAIGGGGGGR